MKLKKIAIVFLGLNYISALANTNVIYHTDFEGLSSKQYARKLKEAKESRESLPAEMFSEGNWGQAVDGFQISLRFNTNKYSIGQPMVGTALIRNVTNTTISYHVGFANDEGPIRFEVPPNQWTGAEVFLLV